MRDVHGCAGAHRTPYPPTARPDIHSRPRERRNHRACVELVPRRGCHRRVLRRVRADCESLAAGCPCASFLLPSGTVYTKQYLVAAQSRFNIWVDVEDIPGFGTPLVNTAVSTDRRLAERGSHSRRARNVVAWGTAIHGFRHTTPQARRPQAPAGRSPTANTAGRTTPKPISSSRTRPRTPGSVQVRLLLPDSELARTFSIPARSRFNVDVAAEFPGAQGKAFGALVEAVWSLARADRCRAGDVHGCERREVVRGHERPSRLAVQHRAWHPGARRCRERLPQPLRLLWERDGGGCGRARPGSHNHCARRTVRRRERSDRCAGRSVLHRCGVIPVPRAH